TELRSSPDAFCPAATGAGPLRAYKLTAPTAFCPIKFRRDIFSTTVSSFLKTHFPLDPFRQDPKINYGI
ncbi:MAG: hypothetical protein DMF73_16660, partial [Acidobacteria bacterium]